MTSTDRNRRSDPTRLPRRRPTRRRGHHLETAILQAAWDVLVEGGYQRFTYEAIAARAQTSRPVLYRRWPHRQDLLIDTLARFWLPIPIPDTGTLRGDALAFLNAANDTNARTVNMLSVRLAGYFRETDSDFSQLRDALRADDQPGPFETIVDRALQRGELDHPPRSIRIINVALDLLRHETLMNSEPTSPAVIEQIVDQIWLPLLKS